MPLSKYVRNVVYLPYNKFWRSKILPIVHVSIFLNTAGPQNARNVLSENLILPTPSPLQESIAAVLARLVVGTSVLSQKKNLATGLAEDNSLE